MSASSIQQEQDYESTNTLADTAAAKEELKALLEAAGRPEPAHQTHGPRLPERRELQIDYSHDQCRPDGGMTLTWEFRSPRTLKSRFTKRARSI